LFSRLNFFGDRLAQRYDAGDRRILGLATADRLDRGVLDVIGRVEIRLAGTEPDNVAPAFFSSRAFCVTAMVAEGLRGKGRRRERA